MVVYATKQEVDAYLQLQKLNNLSIGFVPTMGALHQGHLSLIKESKKKTALTVCSIFVNPTQFNNASDFEKYPITTEADVQQLKNAGTDILFLPTAQEIYPQGIMALDKYNLGTLETLLEGYYRPGHFQGVCQVVHRLLDVVNPNILFLGQKDYQQCLVVQKLITLIQKNIEVCIVPTIREANGLAMSSRNIRLSSKALQQASAIYKAMLYMQENIQQQPINSLEIAATEMLWNNGFTTIDYVSIVEANTLLPITQIHEGQKIAIVVAAFIEGVRLIDNLLVEVS